MPYRNYLIENRHQFCAETALWLEQNRGWAGTDAVKFVMRHYRQMADWLGDGRTAEWAARELLRMRDEAAARE